METSQSFYPPQGPNTQLPPDSIQSNLIPRGHVRSGASYSEFGVLTAHHNYPAVTVLPVNGLTGSLQRQGLVDRRMRKILDSAVMG